MFPTDDDADGIEAFAQGTVQVKELHAWKLLPGAQSGVESITADTAASSHGVNVYDLTGRRRGHWASKEQALSSLPAGIYLIHDGLRVTKTAVK